MNQLTTRFRLIFPIVWAALLITPLILFALQAVTATAQSETIVYVDHDATGGNNDGTDWPNAYIDLQDALGNAVPGSQIWVASGVYKPGNSVDDSFVLTDDIAIYSEILFCDKSQFDIYQYKSKQIDR